MRPLASLTVALSLALLAGCGQIGGGGGGAAVCGSTSGTQVRFDPNLGKLDTDAATWLAAPWPADFRRTPRGTLRMVDFPGSSELVNDYVTVAQDQLDGYSTNGGIYLAFTGALDPSTFPSGPGAGLVGNRAIQLLDVTPGSPEFGYRRPLRLAWRAVGDTYLPANTLAVGPAWGFPLRPKTTYALLVTTGVKDAAGHALTQPPRLAWLLGGDSRCQGRFDPAGADDTVFADFAPLRSLLKAEKVDPATIAAATVFTTQDTLGQMRAIHDQIEATPPPAYDAAGWQAIGPGGAYSQARSFQWSSTQTVHFHVMEGRYDAPNYMEGTVPYDTQGGDFHFENGKPVPVRTEHLRFALTVPDAPPATGACYPIVIYQHGTGGDAYTFVNTGTAGRLAARGLAAIGIDQPLHGLRAEGKQFNVEIDTFNLPNIAAGRTVMRQGAVDTFSLVRFIRESLQVPADKSPTGKAICFDPQRVLFFGHSQGGISGSMTAALETNVHTWMLSGSGGGIAMTVMQRTYPVNLQTLVATFISLDPKTDQPLSDLHPVLTLIQTLVDVSDPLNYSPWWGRGGAMGPGQSVLMTSGLDDQDTPHLTADAEAVAARLPLVAASDGTVADPIPAYDVLGMAPVAPPVSANLGTMLTGGFVQWPKPWNHFVVFENPEAINASMRFLKTAANQAWPVIERDPNPDVK